MALFVLPCQIALPRPAWYVQVSMRNNSHDCIQQRPLSGMEKNMQNDNLVPVYTTKNEGRAEVVRSALIGQGIDATVEGSHQGGFAGALKVRVFVHEDDAARARIFIEEHERGTPSDEAS